MPKRIVVAGGNSKVGKLLVPALQEAGHEVVALVRSPQPAGSAEVIADWMTNPRAARAVRDAQVVVNLTGEINPKTKAGYDEANAAPARRLLEMRDGEPADIAVMIGWAGMDVGSENAFHQAKLVAEALTRRTGREAIIFRASSVMGTPDAPWDFEKNLQTPAGKPGRAFGKGQSRLRPVLGSDLTALIAKAIDDPKAGTYAAQGPNALSLDDYVRLVNRDPDKPISHTPGWLAKLLAPVIGLQRDMVRLFLDDAIDASPDGFLAFGLRPASVVAAWR